MSKATKAPWAQPAKFQKPGASDRIRYGKTRRDKENGCAAQNAANKAARAAWCRGDEKEFPSGTCNGKKSRALKIHTETQS